MARHAADVEYLLVRCGMCCPTPGYLLCRLGDPDVTNFSRGAGGRRTGHTRYRFRSARPPSVPVGCPSSTASRPFTRTQRIPTLSRSGST